jgi:hypothetical protein
MDGSEDGAQLGVRVHLLEVPLQSAPAAGVLVKAHVLDVETGGELRVDAERVVASRCTRMVTSFRGNVAVVEETLVFAAPLQLALQHDVLLLLEIVVPKVARYSSCYAKLGKFISRTSLYTRTITFKDQNIIPMSIIV